ncbi:MAG: hypothetical protein V1721_04770 [Pseudomonadota bacterium]
MMLYIISAISAIAQFFPATVLPGLFFLVIAFFMTKAQRMTAKDTIYASHVEWTARTLSIGTFILFPLAMGIAVYFLWKSTDIEALKATIVVKADDDDPSALMNFITGYIEGNIPRVADVTMKSLALPILWWVRRCWVGFRYAKESLPIDYPESLI